MKILPILFSIVMFGNMAISQEINPWDRQVYFGEQHLHTENSPDAFAMGTRNTPDDAYNFAKGIAIKKNTTGEMIQKKTAYDWAAVTDHSEYLGIMPLLLDPNSPLQKTEIGKMIASGNPEQGEAAFQQIINSAAVNVPIPYLVDPEMKNIAWQNQKDAANRHYEPGVFTTFIAYEWSSQPMSQNLHHNVFFRDSVGPEMVFSSFMSVKREDLWTYQEIPTPRWSTYDAKELGIDVPEGVPTSIQERAYSSPVWYTPDPSVAREKRSYYPDLQIIIE